MKQALQRRGATREPRKVVYVLCEGGVTEPHYLDQFYRAQKERKVALHPPLTRQGEGLVLVRRCLDFRAKRTAARSFHKNDEIWAVFDHDGRDDFIEAIRLAENEGILVAASTPCIEAWGLMHDRPCNALMTSKQAQRQLAAVMPGFDHDRNPQFDWPWCHARLAAAHDNARAGLVRRAEEDTPYPHGTPWSTFYKLLDAIAGNPREE